MKENDTSTAFQTADKVQYIARMLRDFIIKNGKPLYKDQKAIILQALKFVETEDQETIKNVVNKTGAKEMAEWMIEFLPEVNSRKLFAEYVEAKLNSRSLSNTDKDRFFEVLKKTYVELYKQMQITK